MDFYQYKRTQWDREHQLSSGEENELQPGGQPVVHDLPDLQTGNQSVLHPDNQHHNSEVVAQRVMLAVATADTQSQTDPSMFAAEETQKSLGTRSVAWCNGLMAGLVDITYPLLFSMAHKVDLDTVKEMAQRLLSFPDVVTYCSKLAEAYLQANLQDVQLNKYYGMPMCPLLSPCVTSMSACIALCHRSHATIRAHICDWLHRGKRRQNNRNRVRADGPFTSSKSAEEHVLVRQTPFPTIRREKRRSRVGSLRTRRPGKWVILRCCQRGNNRAVTDT